MHGNNKASIWGPKKDIYLINPEGLPWLHKTLLDGLSKGKKCPFNVLWIDESTKFKTFDSVRFGLLTDMLPLFIRRYIMTGTPAPRSLLDLWSQFYVLDEGKTLGHNYYEFRSKYFQRHEYNKYRWDIRDGSAKSIHDLVAPLTLEMSSEDYLDMPEILFNDIVIDLPEKAQKHYREMEKAFFTALDGMEASSEAQAQASMKCQQIANGRVYEDIPDDLDEDEVKAFKKRRKTLNIHKAKQEALLDLVDELNGKPLLIAYHFKHDLAAIKDALGDDIAHIGSGVSAAKAKQIEDDWNAGKIKILVGHPDSMAHGLNLQDGGNDVCWYSLTWNLENYIQFYKRIWRQGVIGSCRCHHLIARNTTDEAMMTRLGERAEEQRDLRTALKMYRKNVLLNKQRL